MFSFGYASCMSPLDNPLDKGVVYQAVLPVSWRLLDNTSNKDELAGLNEGNATLLRMLALFDDAPTESKDADPETAQELARLDAKLSLMLDLVAEVLAHHSSMPKAVPVSISEHGLQWQDSQSPDPGQLLFVEIYLKPTLPRPLRAHAVVVAVKSDKTGTVNIVARFRGMDDTTRDDLAKMIFRHHRRLIASRRGM